MKRPSLQDLPPEILADGAQKAYLNSVELINNANVLLQKKRFPGAYTFYQLSMEEVGKSFLLLEFMSMRNIDDSIKENNYRLNIAPFDYKEMDNVFYGHQHKTRKVLEIQLKYMTSFDAMDKAPLPRGYDTLLTEQIEEVKNDLTQVDRLNELKNLSLYVSLQEGNFIRPEHTIDQSMTEKMKTKADVKSNLLGLLLVHHDALSKFMFKHILIDALQKNHQ